ncbi:MAG: sporulation integral membrane protein YtvI [Clostridiales bacterium]|nr:sporulation integral membrane protein YtvI [Clostridiales bacterium]
MLNKEMIKKVIKLVLILALTMLIITKVLPFISPFIAAILLTFIIENPVQFMQKRLKLSRSLAVAIAILLFTIIIGGTVTLVFYRLTTELAYLTREMPSPQPIIDFLTSLMEKSQDFYLGIPEDIVNALENNLDTIVSTISQWITKLFKLMMDIVKSLPRMFIFLIVSLVSTFFMSRDREKLAAFVFRQMPSSWKSKLRIIKMDLFVAFIGYLKAQLTLLLITFLELLLGFTILRVEYAFFFAIFTAIVDAIPVLGTGTILIPVSAIYLIMGESSRAFAFLMLYIIIMIARQFLEPRIIGSNLGVHPLVMLMSIYIGLKLFGITGLILGPILVIVIKTLQRAEVIPQFK